MLVKLLIFFIFDVFLKNNPGSLYFREDDTHWNDRGQDLAARETARFHFGHSGPPGPVLPAGMDLSSADASFASLVDVASSQVPALDRVSPGDACASYLIQKLEGSATGGSRMPLGGPFLDQATIDVIRRWIDAGAAR